MRVTCKACGAVHPIAPPPWVVSSGRPFRMVCSACGAPQEVVPTGLAVLEDLLPPPEPERLVATEAEPPPLAMPSASADGRGPGELLRRTTLLPTDSQVTAADDDEDDAFDVPLPAGLGRAPGRSFVVRRAGGGLEAADLATLQRWILERRLAPHDVVAEDRGAWHAAGAREDLAVFFETLRRLDAAEVAAEPPTSASWDGPTAEPPPDPDDGPVLEPTLDPHARGHFEQPTVPYVPRAVSPQDDVSQGVIPARPPRREVPLLPILAVGGLLGFACLVFVIVIGQREAAPELPPSVVEIPAAPIPPAAPTEPTEPTEEARPAPPPRAPREAVPTTAAAAAIATPAPSRATAAEPAPAPAALPRVEPTGPSPWGAPVAAPAPAPAPAPAAPPRTLDGLVQAGWEAVDGGDLGKAFDAFDAALGLDGDDVGANYGLGYVLLQRGRLDEARSYLCRALPGARGSEAREIEALLGDRGIRCD